MKTIYFPNLDGLRAIAALTVIILHFNQFLPILFAAPSFFEGNEMAELSVILFFVLSGFLITFLLFQEKEATKDISIKTFYLKRVLRIWPPYFLVLAIAILLFPLYKDIQGNPTENSGFVKSILLYMLILPNLNSVLGLMLTPLRPLWSIGVEEQFYLIWPWGVKKVKNYLTGILVFIILYYAALGITGLLKSNSQIVSGLYTIIRISPVQIMAIGALGALAVKQKWQILKLVYSKPVQIVIWGIYLFSFYQPIQIPYFQHEFYAGLFLLLIINAATNPRSIISLEIKPLKYLGRISYGLYVYHLPMMVVLSLLLPKGAIPSPALLIVVLAITILFASISYEFFEKRIIALRNKLKPKVLLDEEFKEMPVR
ncbi:MAG TPA: acyltransferase [Chryseolinea sp.]